MTREEAINMLQGMRADNLNIDDAYTKDKYDALGMAIEALEQEPCENAISRREAISIAGIATLSVNQVVTALKKLPSVNPQKPICPSAGVDCEDCPAYEDAISRYQKIKQMLYEFKEMPLAPCLMKGHICAVHEILNEVIEPSASSSEKPNKWIPVSERLPEIHQDVLLSLRSLDVEVGFRGNTEPYYYCHGDYIEPQNVLAWQPLPEPYKAEGSGEE